MPVPMRKFTVVTLREYEDIVLESLGVLGITELRKVEVPEFETFRERATEERGELEELSSKFRLLYGRLIGQVRPKPTKEISIPGAELPSYLSEAERKVETILAKLSERERELERFRGERNRLEEARSTSKVLAERGIQIGRLGDFETKMVKAGLISRQSVPKLERYLVKVKDVTYTVTPVSAKESFLRVEGSLERGAWVEAVFAVLNVREFPAGVPEGIKDLIKGVDDDIRRVKKEISAVKKELEAVEQDFVNRVGSIERHLRLDLSGAHSLVFRSKMVSIIEGWVPLNRVPALNKLLAGEERIKGCFIAEYREPKPGEAPPSVIENPRIFKPFEVLTRLYGIPAYGELDPTPILTVVYMVMFGMMFGDVGQGIVLIAMGLIAVFGIKKGMAVAIGKLLVGVGLGATVFGFLYGEFFLMEFMHPILFSPIHELMGVIWLSLYFGIVSIIVALVLGTVNAVKTGHRIDALLGEHGIAALIFYTCFIYAGLRFIQTGMRLSALLHWSLYAAMAGLLMIFIKPVIEAIVRHEGGIFEKLMEGFGQAFVIAIEFLCNTMSYVRLAAFAIAHGALGLVASAMIPLLGMVGPIFANLIALSVELLSTAVQGLRLLYYEFMGKFYKGTGSPFRPFVLEE